MFRAIFYLIATVLIITLIRSVIGAILKGFADLAHPGDTRAQAPGPRPVPSGGELKKDPVCGTFISAATALQKKVRGETFYFCSARCRDEFKGA